eukprot:9690109-Alexandrium_andersonii.AAC.1
MPGEGSATRATEVRGAPLQPDLPSSRVSRASVPTQALRSSPLSSALLLGALSGPLRPRTCELA